MGTYIAIYSIIFFLIFVNIKLNYFTNNFLIILISFFYIFLIGFRFDVGGDWINYEFMYNNVFLLNELYSHILTLNIKNILIIINQINFGFDILTSLSRTFDLGFQGLNFLNAILLILGLYYFSKNKNNKLLIYLISFPILIIIVGMGYTRQASALGLLLISVSFLEERKIKESLFFVFLAFTFHKTAIIFGIVYVFYFNKINLFILISLIILSFSLYFLYFGKQINHILYHYLGPGNDFISIGALPRTSLFLISSLIFLLNPKIFVNSNSQLKLYSSFSLIILFFFPFVLLYSTALDRILLYFFAIQLLIFSQLDFV